MRTSTRATHKANVTAAMNTLVAVTNLAWRAAKVRDLRHPADVDLVQAVREGRVTLDPKAVGQEIEEYLKTVRCHEGCKDHVREYGSATYKSSDPSYYLDPLLCEVCALPMRCKNPGGKHTYESLSPEECRARNIYHGGRCYHVSVCTGCGHVHSVDSSD